MKSFICNQDGCQTPEELPPELEKIVADWSKEVNERIEKRKANGCWNPEAVKCDCPACGGFND